MPYIFINDAVMEDGRPFAAATGRILRDNITRVRHGDPITIESTETSVTTTGQEQSRNFPFEWQVFAPPDGHIFSGFSVPTNFNVRFGTTTPPPSGATIEYITPTSENPDDGTYLFTPTEIPRTGTRSIPNFSRQSFTDITMYSNRLIVPNGNITVRFTMGGGSYSASVVGTFQIIPVYADRGGLAT